MTRHAVPSIQLLGTITVTWEDGVPVEVARPRQRAVLAALALRAGRTVSRAALLRAVWGDRPPASAVGNLQTYVSGLRKLLEPAELLADEQGYRLHLPADSVDALVFEDLIADGRRAHTDDDSSGCLTAIEAASALWRGNPLSGVHGPLADAERARLSELWLSARELRAEVLLASGRAAEVVVECAKLAPEYPLRERLSGLLALGLYRSGRVADALAELIGVRERLRRELGVEPGAELTELYQRMVSGELTGDHVADSAPRPDRPVPAQLPHRVWGFAGRERELAELGESTVPFSGWVVISGMAGAGKTALAIEFAHRVAQRFPDGQLYLDLRGFDLHERQLPVADALEYQLRALGVPPAEVPEQLDRKIDRYRELLAGRRMLIVLDNAATEDQIRPLLPVDGSCLAVVTSRNRLGDSAARRLLLGELDAAASIDLLAATGGRALIDASPDDAARVAELCGHLPLALRIAAVRLADGIGELADELADERGRLDALATDDDDESTAVRAAFNQSYRRLPQPSADLFGLLGVHPGPELGGQALAALVGVTAAEVSGLIGPLIEQNLLDVGDGRYRLHDLVRVYAAERAAELPAETVASAARRLVHWYLHGTHAADERLAPQRPLRLSLDPPPEGCVPAMFTGYDDALAWCVAERTNLVGAARLAQEIGEHPVTWQLLDAATYFFNALRHWADWLTTCQIALDSARTFGDRYGECLAVGCMAQAHYSRGELDEAAFRFQQDIDLISEAGLAADLEKLPRTGLANTYRAAGRVAEAAPHYERVLELLADAPDPFYQAWTLDNLGELYRELGEVDSAREAYEHSLELREKVGQLHGTVITLIGLAGLHEEIGRQPEAAEYYRRAASLSAEIQNKYQEAVAAHGAGRVLARLGSRDEARTWLRRALRLHAESDSPEADAVRAELDLLPAD